MVANLTRIHILHIDDESESHDLLSMAIKGWRSKEVELDWADSEKAAIEKLVSRKFNLVFLDLHLGNRVNGLDLIPKLKKIDPKLEILILSSDASFASAQKAIRAGAGDFIKKGYGKEEILFCLERALERARWKKIEVSSIRNFSNTLKDFAMVGSSKKYVQFERKLKKVAPSEAPVFISGETGSGKELAARSLHLYGLNPAGPFVALNCAAIPVSMAEAFLFGHEKGAFTGADQARSGVFEEADTGTLFLDEINSLPLELQSKLLRVIQEREIRRVGGKRTIPLSFRLVSASNEDIQGMVHKGGFREDLFYRLNVISLELPPLRERKEDIPSLIRFFLPDREVESDLMRLLVDHPWAGNIRELKNVLQRLELLFPAEKRLTKEHFYESTYFTAGHGESSPKIGSLKTLEKEVRRIERQFFEENYLFHKKNVSKMARELRLDRSHLHQKLIQLGIHRAKN